jgi:predicted GIY-YIG superfamily endonuclease
MSSTVSSCAEPLTEHPIEVGRYIAYLVHVDEPYRGRPAAPGNKVNVVQHYLGITRDLAERIHRHRDGLNPRGSKMLHHITKAGHSWRVVRWWPSTTYSAAHKLEKALKRRRNHRALCPICNTLILDID